MAYYTYQGNLRERNRLTSTVNNSYGTTRYFSSLDTEVYIGSTRIYEIAAIDFTIAEPKLPIYGYNSFYANRIVSGRRTVQGTFAINFTGVNYLLNILNSVEDSVMASEYDKILYRCEGEDSTGLGIGNSDIFSKSFDLTVSYGYGKSENPSYKGCYQTLVGVQIVEYRQALDTEGNPILDMYSFIAKDIKYDTQLAEQSSTESSVASGSEIIQDELVSVDYIVANQNIQSEFDSLVSKCTNSDLDGFVVDPTFNHSDGRYFVDLYIDSFNNDSDKLTSISVILLDQSNGINHSCSMKDLSKASSSSFELKDSLRNIGAKLYKNYMNDSNYLCPCTIKFSALVNGKNIDISYSTYLYPRRIE